MLECSDECLMGPSEAFKGPHGKGPHVKGVSMLAGFFLSPPSVVSAVRLRCNVALEPL